MVVIFSGMKRANLALITDRTRVVKRGSEREGGGRKNVVPFTSNEYGVYGSKNNFIMKKLIVTSPVTCFFEADFKAHEGSLSTILIVELFISCLPA